ncbi:MAG TPA: hypothetical protein VIZ90_13245, partial [Rhizobiaceae bacterium]
GQATLHEYCSEWPTLRIRFLSKACKSVQMVHRPNPSLSRPRPFPCYDVSAVIECAATPYDAAATLFRPMT